MRVRERGRGRKKRLRERGERGREGENEREREGEREKDSKSIKCAVYKQLNFYMKIHILMLPLNPLHQIRNLHTMQRS